MESLKTINALSSAIKSKKFWKTIFVDVIFLLCVSILALIIVNVAQSSNKVLAISLNATYLVAVMYGYSLSKYRILQILGAKGKKLGKLILFNFCFMILFAFVITVGYLIIGYFVIGALQKLYFGIFLLLLSFFSYILLNIIQTIISLGRDIYETILIVKNGIWKFTRCIVIEAGGIGVIYLIYVIIYNVSGGRIFLDTIFQTITLFMLMIYNSLNRMMFFSAVK